MPMDHRLMIPRRSSEVVLPTWDSLGLLTNLAALWEMDAASGNETDVIGAKVATASGAIGAASGLFGQTARDLEDADSRYFGITNHADFQIDAAFSVACWAKRESSGNVVLFRKAVADFEWGLIADGTNASFFVTEDGDFGTAVIANAPLVADTNWHHYAGGFTSSGSRIFCAVDGVVQAEECLIVPYVSTNAPRIGVFFDGLIQQVGVWHAEIALSGQLATLYNSGDGHKYVA